MKLLYKFFKVAMLLLCITICTPCLHAQSHKKIDSLLRLVKTAKEDTNKINLLYSIGIIYINTNSKYDSAMYYLNTGFSIATKINSKLHIARGYKGFGYIFIFKSEFNKAIESYNKAIEIFDEIGNKNGLASCYYYCGYLYSSKSIYNKAFEYYFKSLKINEEIGNKKEMAENYLHIADIHSIQNNYVKSLEYFQKGLKIGEEINNNGIIANSYLGFGNVYFRKYENDKAIEMYQKALKIYNTMGAWGEMTAGRIYGNIGIVYVKKGEFSMAKNYYIKQLKICERTGDKDQLSVTLNNFGSLYIKLKQYQKALEYFYKCDSLSKELGNLSLQSENFANLSETYDSLRDYKNAFKYHKLYKEINDSIFNTEKSKDIANMQVKYEIDKKDQELMIQKLKNRQMNYIMLLMAFLIVLLSCLGYIIIRRNKHQSAIKNIQLEQKLLQSQMNPHFIFNALSVIQSIIYEKKTDIAGKYLLKFARLTRLILENSRVEYIDLGKEMIMLENYLELQSLCFENKFTHSIEVDPELSPENIAIPPMLAQPFIENAIEHGIAHKTDTGNIKIRFRQENEMLLFEVEDDGVGREKAKEIEEAKGNVKKHTSLATTITQERIANINKSLKKNKRIKLSIVDLKDEAGTGIGTRVSFSIPLRRK